MASFAKHQLHQAGHRFGKIQNSEHGTMFNGNFNVGGSISVQHYEKSTQERLRDCVRALNIGCTDPQDDRDKIVAVKTQNGRVIEASCEWIVKNSLYRSWENNRTNSQLLWISSAEGRGKTMMAIYLSMELEKTVTQHNNTVLYFFIDRQDKRDTAMHVLRGLLSRLLKVRRDLTHYLLEEYEVQKEALFTKDAIEALWRVFVKMIMDPTVGQVYCIIDGLDYCTDESLKRLISRITNFFRDQSQTVVDDDSGTHSCTSSATTYRSERRQNEQRRSTGLKMLLVSREKPDWMVGQLSDIQRIDIGVRGRKSGTAVQSVPKSARTPPTLASVALKVMHREKATRSPNNNAEILSHSTIASSTPIQHAGSPSNSISTHLHLSAQPPASVTHTPGVTQSQADPQSQSQTLLWQAAPPKSGFGSKVYASDLDIYSKPVEQAWLPGHASSPTMNSAPNSSQWSNVVSGEQSASALSLPPSPPQFQTSDGLPLYDAEQAGGDYADIKIEDQDLENDYGDPALRLYIEASMEQLCKDRQYSTKVQSFIIAALEHRGDDSFLWVDFAIGEIRKASDPDIENIVNSLPPTLTEMYCFILRRIPQHLIDIVAGLLRWSVCAREPLTVLELTVVLNLPQYNGNVAQELVRAAVRACGNMLTITSDTDVNIVHNSLVEFLSNEESPIYRDPHLARFTVSVSKAHSDIANFCIAYLEAGCLNEGYVCVEEDAVAFRQRIAQYPFMTYAASFWPHHLRDAGNPYLNLSSPFFQPRSKIRKNWWITYWGFSTGKATLLAPRDFTLLHLASYLDLVCIAQEMLRRGDIQARLDKKDSHSGTPLDYAVMRGNMAMFRFLIGVGASQKTLFETLLELACRKGQRDITAALIAMGYNVDVHAQSLTVKQTVYNMTRWLPGAISEGLDYNRDAWSLAFRDIGDQRTPLSTAAEYGHSDVVELLLENHAAVNAATTKGFTPLHAASYSGQMDCVHILLKHGATTMAQTADQWLPLHFAASRGKLAVLELFLEKGVPLESMTIKLKTSLHLAAYSGHAEVVQALISRGANLELLSHKGETPLHLAARNRKPQVVELLLSRGANRNAVMNEGKMPSNYVQSSTSVEGKECLRILQTFGMPGYQPWQPPADPNGAAADESGFEHAVSPILDSKNETKRKDSATTYPAQRSFAPVVAPVSYPIQGLQAEITLSGQYQSTRRSHVDPRNEDQPTNYPAYSSPQADQGARTQTSSPWASPVAPPIFTRVQSEPTHSPSKFSYDSTATLQSQQYPRNDVPPPPYMQPGAGNGSLGYVKLEGKWTPAAIATQTTGQSTWQQSTPAQQHNSPHFTPTLNQSLDQTSGANHPGVPQYPAPVGMAQAFNSMSLGPSPSPYTPAPVTSAYSLTQPSASSTLSSYGQPGYTGFQSSNPLIPQIQTPISPMSPPLHAATAPAATPFHPPSPMPPPATPQLQQTPQQYFAVNRSQTVPAVQVSHQYPPSQQQYPPAYALSPIPTQQTYSSQPVQFPHFSGNTTASTYNAIYEYNAPPVTQPYNPGLGASGNGLLFAPPPTQDHSLKKRKSFLGGLIG